MSRLRSEGNSEQQLQSMGAPLEAGEAWRRLAALEGAAARRMRSKAREHLAQAHPDCPMPSHLAAHVAAAISPGASGSPGVREAVREVSQSDGKLKHVACARRRLSVGAGGALCCFVL